MHEVATVGESVYLPAEQLAHADTPEAKVPAGHVVLQLVAPWGERVPASQGRHLSYATLDTSLAFMYRPSLHGEQAFSPLYA